MMDNVRWPNAENTVYVAGAMDREVRGWREGSKYWQGTNMLRWPCEPAPVEGWMYAGPHTISCDHGCYHGETAHGAGADGGGCTDYPANLPPEGRRALVHADCLLNIMRCEVFFAWLDRADCHGTLVEIGWAAGLKKPVLVGLKRGVDLSELWFAEQTADLAGRFDTRKEALAALLAMHANLWNMSERAMQKVSRIHWDASGAKLRELHQ